MENKKNIVTDILVFENNDENSTGKHYRNALRRLLMHANSVKERNVIKNLYYSMFGKFDSCGSAKLFSESKNEHINAEIKATNNINNEFYDYTLGYLEAADMLVMSALVEGSNDRFIYPICFLYRQYIELSLKYFYECYSNDTETEKDDFFKKTNHSLIDIWIHKIIPMIKPLLADKTEEAVLEKIDKYIKEFHNLDNKSMLFRYPMDKSRQLHHKSSQKIDLINLMKKMQDDIEEFLASTQASLDIERKN